MIEFNQPDEEFIIRMLDAMHKSLAIDGEFSYRINLNDDRKWPVIIFSVFLYTPLKYDEAGKEIAQIKIFNRHMLEISVDEVAEYARLAITNMPIYLLGMHLLRNQMAYFDPTLPEKACYYSECQRKFRGPAVFCCHDHALLAA